VSNPSVSVIIVSWNTRELLARCLLALEKQTEAPASAALTASRCEVFVVDNASSDGSAKMVRERFPAVRLIANPDNVGFARANNQALRESTGTYVLLLNPDTEVQPGAVAVLVSFMDQHPEVGAAGARLVNPDLTLQLSGHPAPTLSREVWRLFHLDTLWPYARYPMSRWCLDSATPVDVVQGACMMVRRAALDRTGLLDEHFFIYSEEVDLCQRLRQTGWDVYWVPQAVVVHYGGQSTRQVAPSMFVHLYRAKVRYFRKHHGLAAAQLYKLVLTAAAMARLVLSPIAWLERAPKRQQHLALASHYYRLLRALPEL
jgi:N-acetylglucosaminyl-diphospho-decaprenol L-rhamnosyltransferase